MVTVGFLLSQFAWKVLAAHPCRIARQHSFQLLLGFPVHEVNLDRKSAGSPDNMTESENIGTINENKKHDEILMDQHIFLFIVFLFYIRH
jgi:hypothetical protein